ncbi:MAG: signal transduction histidine kinase, partial [Spirosomataceae bacterium]
MEDTGKGFSLLNVRQGNGIINIRHRVKLLNGEIEIDSKPNAGTSTW